MALFQYPMLTVIQEICARIGLVTGDGLAACDKEKIYQQSRTTTCKSSLNCQYYKHRSRHRCYGCGCKTCISAVTIRSAYSSFYAVNNCRSDFRSVQKICKDTEIFDNFFVCLHCDSNYCRR